MNICPFHCSNEKNWNVALPKLIAQAQKEDIIMAMFPELQIAVFEKLSIQMDAILIMYNFELQLYQDIGNLEKVFAQVKQQRT